MAEKQRKHNEDWGSRFMTSCNNYQSNFLSILMEHRLHMNLESYYDACIFTSILGRHQATFWGIKGWGDVVSCTAIVLDKECAGNIAKHGLLLHLKLVSQLCSRILFAVINIVFTTISKIENRLSSIIVHWTLGLIPSAPCCSRWMTQFWAEWKLSSKVLQFMKNKNWQHSTTLPEGKEDRERKVLLYTS